MKETETKYMEELCNDQFVGNRRDHNLIYLDSERRRPPLEIPLFSHFYPTGLAVSIKVDDLVDMITLGKPASPR